MSKRALYIIRIQNIDETRKYIKDLIKNMDKLSLKTASLKNLLTNLMSLENILDNRRTDLKNDNITDGYEDFFKDIVKEKTDILNRQLKILKNFLLENEVENIENYFELLDDFNEFVKNLKSDMIDELL